jgi:hypothetical protein
MVLMNSKHDSADKKQYSLLYSKWVYYYIIGIVLVVITTVMLYLFSLNNELAHKFIPTIIGIDVNFLIFTFIFNIRERLEWKSLEDKVNEELKKVFFSVHLDLLSLTQIDVTKIDARENEFTSNGKFNIGKFNEIEADLLINSTYEIKNLYKFDDEFSISFQVKATSIGRMLERHGRFLKPQVQCTLMDLEDQLETLALFLISYHIDRETREYILKKTIKDIEKTMLELQSYGFNWMHHVKN